MSVPQDGAALAARFPKFHLGCGPVLLEGYLNIDGDFPRDFPNLAFGVPMPLPSQPQRFVYRHDLRRGIPAPKNSLAVIYHSHFLEHLTDQEGRALLLNCFNCLKEGGVMRLAVPDFRLWCSRYVERDKEYFDWYRRTYLGGSMERYPTDSSVFAGMLYNWGHKHLYDAETLHHVLRFTGFTSIQTVSWGVSCLIPEIADLEGDSSRRHESLLVEAIKE
jgi:predicted SAM-dependent methyltransferase